MKADELKTKARERLAEIASERKALASEERELRVMLGDVPPVNLYADRVRLITEREQEKPMVRPMPYDVHTPAPVQLGEGWTWTGTTKIRDDGPMGPALYETFDAGLAPMKVIHVGGDNALMDSEQRYGAVG